MVDTKLLTAVWFITHQGITERQKVRLHPGGGHTLAALIRQRGHTQAGAAAAAGCSASFMSKLCNGEKTSCSDDLAARIADLLGVPTDILFVPAQSPHGLRNVTTMGGVR